MTVVLSGLVHPVIVKIGEQIAPAEGRGLLEVSSRDQLLEVMEVDLHFGPRFDPHAVACGDHRIRRRLAELAPESDKGGPQARSRAAVENVGPEHRGYA